MDADYPRLLFFTSQIPQTRHAGCMQLYRALQGYPGECLRVIGPPIVEGAQGLPCVYKTQSLLTYRLVNTRFRRWVTGVNALDLLPEPGLSRTLSLVEGFRPDLVVTVMDNLSFYKHAWKLAQRLGAGFVTITMDDPQTFEVAHPLLQGAFDRLLSRLYQSTALSIGVSCEMCDYLRQKYGRASETFYFGPPEGLRIRPAEDSLRLRDPARLTLAFAGSMSLGYPEGIRSLLPALRAANARLHVYTHYKDVIEDPCIVNRGFLAPEALWPVVQEECDAVLLPYAFEGEILKLYRTHFPTKISEYCWTGMPILITGPDSATGVRWGMRHPEAALVATDPAVSVLAPMLERLRTDDSLRSRLAAGSAAIALSEFEPRAARSRFVELMRQARAANKPHTLTEPRLPA
jgi:hypothetical protein